MSLRSNRIASCLLVVGWTAAAMFAVGFMPTARAQAFGEVVVRATRTALVAPAPVSPAVMPMVDCPGQSIAGEGKGPCALLEPQPVMLRQPSYPVSARDAGKEGSVVVCFTVTGEGRVAQPAVRSSTDAVFEAPVLQAIAASTFRPARSVDGPVRSTACRTYRFMLK